MIPWIIAAGTAGSLGLGYLSYQEQKKQNEWQKKVYDESLALSRRTQAEQKAIQKINAQSNLAYLKYSHLLKGKTGTPFGLHFLQQQQTPTQPYQKSPLVAGIGGTLQGIDTLSGLAGQYGQYLELKGRYPQVFASNTPAAPTQPTDTSTYAPRPPHPSFI